MSRPTVAIVLLLAAASCAHKDPLDAWRVITSDHFRVYTAATPLSYSVVIDRLEEVRAGFAASFFGGTALPKHDVILLRAEDAPPTAAAYDGWFVFVEGRPGVLVLHELMTQERQRRAVAHELAHAFVTATFRSAPSWFNEGFAEYAESMYIASGRVWFGARTGENLWGVRFGSLVPVAELFGASYATYQGRAAANHYATGWAIVHYLLHGEGGALRGRFDAFAAALQKAGEGPMAALVAWDQVFPEIPFSDLDLKVRVHVERTMTGDRAAVIGFAARRTPRLQLTVAPADTGFVRRTLRELRRDLAP